MQLKSNNNACKTPNLAVCILLTLTKWECIWDTQNTQVNGIQRSEQEIIKNYLKILKTHEWMHAIDTKLKIRH